MSGRKKAVGIGVTIACLGFLAWYLIVYGRGPGQAKAMASAAVGEPTTASDEGEAERELQVKPVTADATAPDQNTSEAGESSEGGGERTRTTEKPPAGSGSEVGEVSGPRIEFDNDTFDFGTLYQREEVEQEFAFRNAGDETLVVTKVESTCGCAAALLSDEETGPGEKGTVKVTVRAGLLRGKLTKHVYIESNAVNEPRATLIITGEIKQEVAVEPLGFYIGRRKVGETRERTFTIRGVEAKEFGILRVTTDDPALQVGEPVRLEGEVARYEVRIRFGPMEEAGRVNLKVMVHTDLEHTPEIAIPVYGRVVEGETADVGAANEKGGE